MNTNWDKQGDTHFLDVQDVGRYSIARKAKGSREFALKLNGKSTEYTGTVEELKHKAQMMADGFRHRATAKTTLVYDRTDPVQHVGEILPGLGRHGHEYVRWHKGYATHVRLADVVIAPADARLGDKLAVHGRGRTS